MIFKVEAWAAMVAFLITMAFILWPSPYLMALFAFFAQPLFLIVGLIYLRRVFKELKQRQVL